MVALGVCVFLALGVCYHQARHVSWASGQKDPHPPHTHTHTRTHRSLTGHLCTAKHTQRMFHLHRAKQLSSPAHYLIKDRRHLCPLTSLDDWPCYHTHTAPLTHAEARRGIKTLLHEVSSGATQHFKNGCSAASSSACAIHHS